MLRYPRIRVELVPNPPRLAQQGKAPRHNLAEQQRR